MDGTALDDRHRLSKENADALKRAAQAGHEIVVTTGRPTSSAGYLYRTYGLREIGVRYMLTFNGGMMLDCISGETVYQKTLPLEYAWELVSQAHKDGIYIQSYEGEYVLAERDDENLAHYRERTNMKARIVPDLRAALKEEPCKVLAINVHTQEPMLKFRERLKDWAGDKVGMYFSCTEYMEIVPLGVSKGNALLAFCDKFGISRKDTIAAGDENNDISMIEAAGVGCAVANAKENVKAAADYVTKRDNNHSAVAEIVDRFMS